MQFCLRTGFQGQGLNCWLVGDQIELLFEDRIVGDLMMMELLAIKMNFCPPGSNCWPGDQNELLQPRANGPRVDLLAMRFRRH